MSTKVFGELLENTKLKGNLPVPVYDVIHFFKDNPLYYNTEGLFRIPGQTNAVNELKHKYDEGESVDLSKYEIHAIAAMFKAYFRELPDSLVTEESTDLFLVFIELDQIDKQQTITKLRHVLDDMPLFERCIGLVF